MYEHARAARSRSGERNDMNSYTIIEIAVVNSFGQGGGIFTRWPADHYWRIRWIEDGEQVDADLQFADLRDMSTDAKRYMATGETVVWRYYETGI